EMALERRERETALERREREMALEGREPERESGTARALEKDSGKESELAREQDPERRSGPYHRRHHHHHRPLPPAWRAGQISLMESETSGVLSSRDRCAFLRTMDACADPDVRLIADSLQKTWFMGPATTPSLLGMAVQRDEFCQRVWQKVT
ncbi:hypothetical protein D8B21_21160, partial [Verminephrobacter aporrectodeae subsp. tuberculatae]|nr:hypothetical protein [Verminephrobacter aporrectodeae subsp. tuberculatae]